MLVTIQSFIPYYWAVFLLIALASKLFKLCWSTSNSLVIWAIFGMSMELLAPLIKQLNSELSIHIWYGAWIFLYGFSLVSIVFIHDRNKKDLSRVSIILCCYALAMMFLQIFRYAERFILETNSFQWLYQYGVPAINYAVLAVVVTWFFSVVMKKEGQC